MVDELMCQAADRARVCRTALGIARFRTGSDGHHRCTLAIADCAETEDPMTTESKRLHSSDPGEAGGPWQNIRETMQACINGTCTGSCSTPTPWTTRPADVRLVQLMTSRTVRSKTFCCVHLLLLHPALPARTALDRDIGLKRTACRRLS